MKDVAIIGIGMTRFGDLWDRSLRQLFTEAALAAIDDAGVDHVDALYAGCMSSGVFNNQEHLGALAADYLGQKHIPGTRVESACASGALALRCAIAAVASGMHDIVLAGGVEKMTDVSGGNATFALGTAADADFESFPGVTFPGLYAMMARAHMDTYGTTREMLSAVSIKNHKNGAMNPRAQFRSAITEDTVLNSPLVATPFHLFDCSPITDGAAACIVCSVEKARELGINPVVRVAGSGHATDTLALYQRDEITWLAATAEAAKQAYNMAGVGPEDIRIAEVHDCFTIAEIMVIEALGFVEKGKGGPFELEGHTALTGKKPINTSGGLKSKGHPVGATGLAQIFELVTQLREQAGDRQVPDVKRALAQNMGGSGGSAVVHILEVI